MKKTLPLFLILTSCSKVYVPVDQIRIEPPRQEIMNKAKPLPEIKDNSMGYTVEDSTKTDIIYNDVGSRYNELIDYVNCVLKFVNEDRNVKC